MNPITKYTEAVEQLVEILAERDISINIPSTTAAIHQATYQLIEELVRPENPYTAANILTKAKELLNG